MTAKGKAAAGPLAAAAGPLADDVTPTANPHRGEIAVDLGGTRFVLRPDFEAVSAIDDALGSVIEVARRGVGNPAGLSLAELAVIVTEGIRASGRANKTSDAHAGREKIKRMIFDAGIPSVIGPVMLFLAAAITGGAKQEPGESGKA